MATDHGRGADSCGREPVGCPPLTAHAQTGVEVSYQSRVKKRRYKRVAAKVRRSRSAESAGRWFLTLAKRPGKFSCCGRRFERGGEIVFRKQPHTIRSVRCADPDPESKGYRTSLRYDKAKRKAATA
jgi:hypothetical protein